MTKTNKKIKATVHNGVFHADDVICVAMLRYFYGKDNVEVVRTRDKKTFEECDFILDVGGKDLITEDQVWLDHHQPDSLIRENGVKAAACGKLADVLWEGQTWLPEFHKIFLDGVEAQDNGQDAAELGILPSSVSFVNAFVPNWDSNESMDKAFMEAVEIIEVILEKEIQRCISKANAETLVKKAINESSEGVLILPQFMPWQTAVVQANENRNEDDRLKLVVFKGSDGSWNLQVVPKSESSFESWILLPEEWAGKRNSELAAATGIDDSIFCHIARFLAVFGTKESAMKAAALAVK